MPTEPVPQTVCGVPGCERPRLIIHKICPCEDDDCDGRHVQPECCKRHSRGYSGQLPLWIPNDGLIDRRAIDLIVHEGTVVRVTWVEALIVTATFMAIGYSENEATRRLGFDAKIYRHGIFRGHLLKNDIKRAIAAIQGVPLPPVPPTLSRGRYAARAS